MSLLDDLLNTQPDQGALGPQGRDILSEYLMGPSQAAAPSSSIPAPVIAPQQTDPPVAQTMPGIPATTPSPSAMDAIGITGWKPEHRTTLGTIADVALSLLSGRQVTPFRDKAEGHNLDHAMEGFTSDPLATIQKIARIPGMEGKALGLYQQYITEQRQQDNLDRQNSILDRINTDDYWNKAGSAMKSTIGPDGTPDPVKWSKMRQIMTQLASKYKIDPDLVNSVIPEQPDADSVDTIYNGAIKPAQQETINVRKDSVAEKTKHDRATEQQQSINEGGRNSRFQQGEAGKNNRQQTGISARQQQGNQIIGTKYGPGMIFNKGKNLSVKAGKNPDGSDRYAIYENKGPDQWHLAGYQTGSKPK